LGIKLARSALRIGHLGSGPRLGKYTRDGKPNAIIGHDIVIVLTGCFILAFGWFDFNPGSTLGTSGNGHLRISSVAVNTMLAGMTGGFGILSQSSYGVVIFMSVATTVVAPPLIKIAYRMLLEGGQAEVGEEVLRVE
jgi:ammonia channel protein AmtB